MTEKRAMELLKTAIPYIPALAGDRQALYNTLHHGIGMTNEELMECGMEHLRDKFQYEWAAEMPEYRYAKKLDDLLPQSDVYTTSKWMEYLRELADSLESSFAREAADLLFAFREITEEYPPLTVMKVYDTIHIHGGALLPREVIMAAAAAQRGATVQELSEMAASGAFENGRLPVIGECAKSADKMMTVESVIHEYKLDALEAALNAEGSSVEDRMQDYLIELYSKFVPHEEQEEIRSRIDAEHAVQQEMKMM